MGSGRGQSRRARTSLARVDLQDDGQPTPGSIVRAALPLTFDGKKWQSFVDDNGLRNINVTKYYLGSYPASPMMISHREKVITELFKDAVAVGAIVLPPNCIAHDFEFKVTDWKKLEVIMRHKRNFRVEITFAVRHMTETLTTMARTTYSLKKLNRGVSDLLALAHE